MIIFRRCLGLAAILLALSSVAQAQSAKMVIIVSIDGLHQADLADPALSGQIPGILSLAKEGVSYSQATGAIPADSFPGTLAFLTGAGPATTGIYYDDMFFRDLAPGPGSPPTTGGGVEVRNTEYIDKNYNLLNGGGDFGFASIDPEKLPLDPIHHLPVYPHQNLKVNTIFEIAHAAGLRTSLIEKHPAYEIAAGPSGKGIDDLYCPEIYAPCAVVDGKLVDASAVRPGIKLDKITKSPPRAIAYDDLKLTALLREIHGEDARGVSHPGPPALVEINLQAVNIGEKDRTGGIEMKDGREVVAQPLTEALKHTDAAIANLRDELKSAGLWDQTLLIITSKHGQSPRVGTARAVGSKWITQTLGAASIPIAGLTQDQTAIIWLTDPAQAAAAAAALTALQSSPQNPGITRILFGQSLQDAHLAGSADRSPDVIVQLQPDVLLLDLLSKRAEHGAYCEDDTHVPIILSGGALDLKVRGSTVTTPVTTTQIAVTALQALGLDAGLLQGAKIEGTQPLPGTKP